MDYKVKCPACEWEGEDYEKPITAEDVHEWKKEAGHD